MDESNDETVLSGTRVWRVARLGLVTFAGALVVVLGIILLPLPGPGTLVVLCGLSILSTEYSWARRALAALRAWLYRCRDRVLAFRARRVAPTRPTPLC